jgi:hypothetical protein
MKIVQQKKAFLNIVYFLIRQFDLRPTNQQPQSLTAKAQAYTHDW